MPSAEHVTAEFKRVCGEQPLSTSFSVHRPQWHQQRTGLLTVTISIWFVEPKISTVKVSIKSDFNAIVIMRVLEDITVKYFVPTSTILFPSCSHPHYHRAYRRTRSSLQLGLRVGGHLALADFGPDEPQWTLAYGWRRRWQHYKYLEWIRSTAVSHWREKA